MNHRTLQLTLLWLLFACPTSDAATNAPSFHLTGSMVLERPTFTNAATFEVKVHGREWQIVTEEGKDGLLESQHFDGTNMFHTTLLRTNKFGRVAEAEYLRFGQANIRILWFAFCSAEVLRKTNWVRAPWFPEFPFPGAYSHSVGVESKLTGSELPANVAFKTSTARWRAEVEMWRGRPEMKEREFLREFVWAEKSYPDGVVQVRYRVTQEQNFGGLHLPKQFELVRFKQPGGEPESDVVGAFRGKVASVTPLLDTNLTLSTSGLRAISDFRFADASGTNLVVTVRAPTGWMAKNDPELLTSAAKEKSRLERQALTRTLKRVWPAVIGPAVGVGAIAIWLLVQRKKGKRDT